MLVRILSNQIQQYEDVINETIEKTIPEAQPQLLTKLYEELLFGIAQCWVSTRQGKFEAIILTKIEENTACGAKCCVIISGYAPNGTNSASFYEGWKDISKFAIANDCDRISLYTNNPEIEKYMHMFDLIWDARYYQVRLNREN